MMRRACIASVGFVLLFGLADCGGKPHVSSYTLTATRACFQKAGFQARTVANPSLPGEAGNLLVRLANAQPLLAPTAPGGTVTPNVFVFLVFDKNAASARATENRAIKLALQTFAGKGEEVTRAYVQAGVGLVKNVFYYSPTGAVTKLQRAKISSCLR